MGKILKVKDIAKQYGVPAKSVIEELAGQGIEADDAENSVIPDDMIELVEMYFADLYDQDSEPAAAADKKPAKKGGKKLSYEERLLKSIMEVVKYMTKFDYVNDTTDRLTEMYNSLKGHRQLSTWGVLYRVPREVEQSLDSMTDEQITDFVCQI